ncbi:MAG: DUF4365 domain-containing protein [Acidobacteriota bacterium]|nr:DUF4365 domain-containing protein [Acidobacteriota bacterium]
MMTQQHVEEWLSHAYVMAIAARAGVGIGRPFQDYGVDGTFSKIQFFSGRRFETGVKIDFQLKASKNWKIEGESVVYDLEAKTYNDIVNRSLRIRSTPLMLILLCLPQDSAQWLEQSEDHLIVRRCCYWSIFSGTATQNSHTARIRISRHQLFTPDVLMKLLDQVEEGRNIL